MPDSASEAFLHGRPIVAGLAYPVRAFSSRATFEEIWAGLDIATTPSGWKTIWSEHQRGNPSNAAHRRFSAYIKQSKSFFIAASMMDVLSRPLAGYYAILNLSKAWLTLQDPAVTAGKAFHGASDAFTPRSKYSFSQEQFKSQASGIFNEIASRTGAKYTYPEGTTRKIAELAPYLVEGAQDFESSIATPRVLSIRNLMVIRGPVADGSGSLQLRAEIDANLLKARSIRPHDFETHASHFSRVFSKVPEGGSHLVFVSNPVRYGRNTRHALPEIAEQFENALLHVNRGAGDGRYFVVMSPRADLLSQEAVSFAVMLHLSNMVRYRPEQVEKVASERWAWLLSTWVPRALENALLAYGTRILCKEMRIEQATG